MEDPRIGSGWRISPLLTAVAIGGLLYVIGQYVGSQPQRIQQEQQAEREITVQGQGEVQSKPDVAVLMLGVTTGVQATAEAAMDKLGQTFDGVVAAVKATGVNEDDIKTTNLSVQPVYDYSEGRQTLRGFQASESIQVNIRDLGSIGEVVARATGEGVNQTGGITFEVDDPAELQAQAEEQAIEDAREKAERLAKALDVRLGNVKSYSTSQGGGPIPIPLRSLEVGGPEDITAPPVPVGTNEISVTVTITYELR